MNPSKFMKDFKEFINTPTDEEYWRECLESSLIEHGIAFTDEQLNKVVYDVDNAHHSYNMAFPKHGKVLPKGGVK